MDEQALRRELVEETGLEAFELGPLVWTRTHLLDLDHWDGQVERYYLVRTPVFKPRPRLSWAQLHREFVTAIRWWKLAELEATEVELAPRRLPALVRELIMNGAPAEPVEVGV